MRDVHMSNIRSASSRSNLLILLPSSRSTQTTYPHRESLKSRANILTELQSCLAALLLSAHDS